MKPDVKLESSHSRSYRPLKRIFYYTSVHSCLDKAHFRLV